VIDAAARDAFRLTADPTFFWRHGQYARIFDALRAAVLAGEQFTVLIGDAGTGKTMLVNALGQTLTDDGVFVGRLIYGRLETSEIWSALAHAFGLTGLESREAFTNGAGAAFRSVCGARAAVLIVDEAHILASDALVEIERLARVLSPGGRPVLSVLLVGLPELRANLKSADCAGLGERIGTSVEVVDLSPAEVASYIRHRLEIAGANPELLPGDIVGRITTASGGTPALINEMCHAFVAGFDAMLEPITARRPAISSSWFDRGRWPPARIGLVVAGVTALAMTVFAGVHYRRVAPPPAVEAPERAPTQVLPSVTGQPAQADLETTPPLPRATRATTPAARTTPAPTAAPQSAGTTSRRQDDQPDPSDVIDWLLKEGAGRR
jgi:general secretion pathway protein A